MNTGKARVLTVGALAAASAIAFVVACSSSEPGGSSGTTPTPESGKPETSTDTGVVTDAGGGGPDGRCADTFGTGLTDGFGRIDGTVYAIQRPGDESCAQPNRDHVVLQILMKGSVYRMVVNVQSDRGADPKIRVATVPHALPAVDFDEGWHTGIPLDYPQILGVHSGDGGFTALTLAEAVARIESEVKVGDPVAVYGTSGPGRPESAHLIHRNTTEPNQDGAIVVRPDSATPKFMLFHFADQAF
ncbi:MAG: hypothetical protein JST00_22895 [Deltaproteobacteria bacterium]|nr:hypothetical protein [Deltaproteobacteria bacterium]